MAAMAGDPTVTARFQEQRDAQAFDEPYMFALAGGEYPSYGARVVEAHERDEDAADQLLADVIMAGEADPGKNCKHQATLVKIRKMIDARAQGMAISSMCTADLCRLIFDVSQAVNVGLR